MNKNTGEVEDKNWRRKKKKEEERREEEKEMKNRDASLPEEQSHKLAGVLDEGWTRTESCIAEEWRESREGWRVKRVTKVNRKESCAY